MTTYGDSVGPSQPPRRAATVLESVEEVRDQIRRARTVKEAIPGAQATAAVTGQAEAQPDAETQVFRPLHRPTMALLVVMDDGDDAGETIRIRNDRFVIGRAEGDLIIPHDGSISGRHAELTRRAENGQFNWYLKDLQSSNGTFVRVSRAWMGPNQEILLGGRRYRVDTPPSPAATANLHVPAVATTRKWQVDSSAEMTAIGVSALVEQVAQGEGKRFPLSGTEQWIGRDPNQCSIVIDDPMLSPRHARLYRDSKGRWIAENARSLNGLWLRISEAPLDRGGHFQCGEQRFSVKIL